MENAKKLVTIRDTDYEGAFGYVYSVSGPGTDRSSSRGGRKDDRVRHVRACACRPLRASG